MLDECWVSDEQGTVYITTVRDEAGAPTAFRFNPDPAVQPQASAFYPLLSSPADSDDVVAQEARVREIDNEIFKYVGVSGVDRPGIVQVGNALAFDEQAAVGDTYVSPVMTAVTAAFDEPDLLEFRHTSAYDEIRAVFDGILGQHMSVQAALVDRFLSGAEAAAWSTDEINRRLWRIVRSTPTEADGPIAKHVTLSGSQAPRMIQVGYPIDDGLPVSPRFGSTHPR